jgi:hypothetical protein
MKRERDATCGLAALTASLLAGLLFGACSSNGAASGADAGNASDAGDAGDVAMPTEGGDGPPTCPTGKEPCGRACVDLASDSANCGACGNACMTDHFCHGATCVTCADGNRTSCSGVCADLSSDPANCGACAKACANGQVCSSGGCVETCTAAKNACGASCVDLTSDPQNCGECGHSCAAGQSCSAGACRCSNASQVACGSTCISPDTDAVHCGATPGCGAGQGFPGTACAKSGYCQMGACQICQTWSQGWSIDFPDVTGNIPFFAMADFDGDGKSDIAVLKIDASAVTVLKGNGDGTFTTGASFPTSPAAMRIGTGDFDGDGKTDLVVGARAADYLTVMIGHGDGTFATPLALTRADAVENIAVGDLDGDGRDDIVAGGGGFSGTIDMQVFLGSTAGSFKASSDYSPIIQSLFGYPYGELAVVDADGDGKRDLVIGTAVSAGVMFGNGDGTLGPAAWTTGPSFSFGATILTGDVNGDGHLDFVAPTSSGWATLLGNAGGNARAWTLTTPMLFQASTATLADVTGDSVLDLVGLGGATPSTLLVRLGRGDGTFVPGASFVFAPNAADTVVAAELNGDSYPDVVGATYTGLQVMLGGRANQPECP